ncbi:sigma-70 family RNA polymerase sigma factor [Lysinibacillus sp. KU-BSD001]|uniref:sigma-70 family RNA polymerase sigma factor n=1 Tax=Lysinibacillus sp. KU-BSD001 TaxID=3141328 RepID=UPI0036EAF5FC
MSTLTVEQEQLVIEHNRLVHYFAHRFYQENMDHADMVQIGTIGLIKASKVFDASRGYKFSTIAGKCIKNEIIKSFRKKRVQATSLNSPLLNNAKYTERIELIDNDINIQNEVPLNIDLQNALSKLDELERLIIKYSFGLEGFQCLTQSQIAKMVNISRSHVGRLKKSALEKLRKELEGVYNI